jgi:hypothetical protein
MPSINVNRRHLEEAQRRRAIRQRAEGLEGRRGSFVEYMKQQGFSSEQREAELRKFDELVERLGEQAEYEAIDGL